MASSSLSSLNTLQPCNKQTLQRPVHHSSSNSVISTSEESSDSGGRACSSSNYDSGAFSRSSSPTDPSVPLVSLSMSRLALAEPLLAPKLVLAACRGEWPPESPIHQRQRQRSKVSSNIAAAASSRRSRRGQRARSMSAVVVNDQEDVTVTVGANTKLTIGSPGSSRMQSNLRRSRSGLPVLGTNALRSSPVKPLRSNIRTKISTVYLEQESSRSVHRSSSIVTVMGSKPSGIKCDCNERVTVNGQHHCVANKHHIRDDLKTSPKKILLQHQADHRSNINTTSPIINIVSATEQHQPSSIIEIWIFKKRSCVPKKYIYFSNFYA